jgi:4-alpha-glucanotransferase
VVALMSCRHHCLVVGEDLGTLPPGFSATLARAGVLSSRVLLFERKSDGEFYPASRYSKRAMVTANTHDHVTLAGYARGRDLELRRELGLLEADDFDAAVAERQRDLGQLRRRLHLGEDATPADLTAAVHAFLGRTPSPLVGVSLDDLAGETEPVNIPGVSPELYPSWTRRMTVALHDLVRGPHVLPSDGLRGRGPREAGEHMTGSEA